MNVFFKYLKSIIFFFISLIIIPFLLTLSNIFKIETNKIIIIIIWAIIMFISGFLVGKKTNNKGYLKGLLFSIFCIFILLLLSLIFGFKLNINSLIYYIILIISTTFGSMMGISKSKKTNKYLFFI